MFTWHEIVKHEINSDTSGTSEESGESVEENEIKRMTINLCCVDVSFAPKRSARTGTEIVPKYDPRYTERVHRFKQYIGDGTQTFRWLVLAARERLLGMYKLHGKVRYRERCAGIAGAYIPSSVKSEDPQTDGDFLKGCNTLNSIVRDGDTIWIEFNQDGGAITKWEQDTFYTLKGTDYHEPEREVHEMLSESDSDYISEDEDRFKRKQPKPKPELRKERCPPSFFLLRRQEAECRDYYETKDLYRRAFKTDWKRIQKNCFPAAYQNEVKKIMHQYYPNLSAVYRYFSATGTGDPFDMGVNDVHEMLRQSQIHETNIGSIWAATNYHGTETDESGALDDDSRSLSRYELLEFLLRLCNQIYESERRAYAKHLHEREQRARRLENTQLPIDATADNADPEGKDENEAAQKVEETKTEKDKVLNPPAKSFAERLEIMLDQIVELSFEHINGAEIFFADSDIFRRERLYFEEVTAVLNKFANKLYTIYRCFSKRSRVRTRQGGSEADALLYYKEFMDLFRASGILKLPKYAETSSRADISLAFVCSQMEVVDVLSKKRKGLAVDDATDRATFLEFCEAVARACDLFTIEFDASLGGVDLAHLPPLSRQLEVFLPAFVDGFGKDFWNDNRIINYDKAMTAKHAPYNKRYNKFGPGPDFRRVELNPDDTRHNSDYFRKFHIQIRVLHAVVRLPKILEERTNERDKKILDKMKLAEKQAVQDSLKAQAMARKAQR